ncbi:hypothetical protein ACIQZM_11095 [Peribacillus sp. NPDC097206]
MNTWKDAFWLASIEWRKSWFGTLCLFFALFVLAASYSWVLEVETQAPSLLTDIGFILSFGCVAFMVRPKELQLQKVEGDVWVSPFFMMLNMFPIEKEVLIKSRFVHMLFPSLPFQVLFLLLFTPRLLESMVVLEYVAFSIIWLAFGVSSSFVFAASDVGERITPIKLGIYSVVFYGGVTAVLVWLSLKTDRGVVGWAMEAAKNFAIGSSLISAVVTVGSYYFWKRYMKKKMFQIDYLK